MLIQKNFSWAISLKTLELREKYKRGHLLSIYYMYCIHIIVFIVLTTLSSNFHCIAKRLEAQTSSKPRPITGLVRVRQGVPTWICQTLEPLSSYSSPCFAATCKLLCPGGAITTE